MKDTLASLFKPYHPLQPIVAHANARMKGQAFVSFRDSETAGRALLDVNEFPLYGKPVVRAPPDASLTPDHPVRADALRRRRPARGRGRGARDVAGGAQGAQECVAAPRATRTR